MKQMEHGMKMKLGKLVDLFQNFVMRLFIGMRFGFGRRSMIWLLNFLRRILMMRAVVNHLMMMRMMMMMMW